LALALFLTCLEATIVSTSLVTITNDLDGSGQSSWVITAYLLTYTGSYGIGFLIIWSNCSAIIGVKKAVLGSLFLFVVFSGGCAASNTLSQLIICRAFQGLGGAGVYSLNLYAFVRVFPYRHFDKASSFAGGISSLGLVLGPLLGGVIANNGSWRWIFLYNIPVGVVSWGLIYAAIPSHFPEAPPDPSEPKGPWIDARSFSRIDFLGAALILTSCSFIISALQEGNSEYAWGSSLVISFFVISGIACIAFVWWERVVCIKKYAITPVFPWWLMKHRVFMGVAFGFLTSGLPLFVCIIEIPQRFQVVNGSSPLGAGIKLLSFSVSCPVGIIACSVLAGRFAIPFVYIILAGIACEVTGMFLFSEIAGTSHVWTGQFGYLVLAGLGVGLSIAAFYMAAPLVVEEDDHATAIGIGIQFRTLGGVLGIAASTTILNHYLTSRLAGHLSPQVLAELQQTTDSIKQLSPESQVYIREVFAMAYSMQMKLAGAFSAAQVLAVALIWKRGGNVRYLKPENSF
ncbi:major facilitator superfamily domain-containing protein, partial [Penicillium malachiteum]